MQQKKIWMTLLLIGTLNSFQSCKIVDDMMYVDTYFVNHSDYDISIESIIWGEDHEDLSYYDYIRTDSILFQRSELNLGSRNGIIYSSDSVCISISDSLKVSYSHNIDSQFNILILDNYSYERVSDNHDKFTYVFTNADFKDVN
ncbi:MAG: hypothetical protein P1P82_08185 [Bacteroidales bacterium]|nr:hypothetical protein [Bacteroidales bacterium]MDT8430309.1 hypothetical protein [Bacteroidales bacterium]